jgi:tetratricopeptide (TPR) repeat protein
MPADISSDVEGISISEEISPQNQETLKHIASIIRLAETFRVVFVKCNQPVQCRQMAARLKEMLAGEADIVDVHLKEPVSSLRRAILASPELVKHEAQAKRAIQVFGFERSIPSEGPAPALDELNQSRENFPKSFSGPFLIWLPDYALTRLAREAPDFWGWRSGVFEFSPERKFMDFVGKSIIQDVQEDRLSLEQKIERATALDGLIGDYREMPRGERENRAFAEVLRRRGDLHYLLGEHNEAFRMYEESLKISEEIGDRCDVSRSLHRLGILAQDNNEYDKARKYYQKSLKISQEIEDKNRLSKSLHQLGMLAQDIGEYDEARKLYQKSLKISQNLGEMSSVSKSSHQLGMLAQYVGDYEKARKLYQKSLKIDQDLGDKSGVSKSLHQLGMLAQDIGEYDEARKLFKQSLKIHQDLIQKEKLQKKSIEMDG